MITLASESQNNFELFNHDEIFPFVFELQTGSEFQFFLYTIKFKKKSLSCFEQIFVSIELNYRLIFHSKYECFGQVYKLYKLISDFFISFNTNPVVSFRVWLSIENESPFYFFNIIQCKQKWINFVCRRCADTLRFVLFIKQILNFKLTYALNRLLKFSDFIFVMRCTTWIGRAACDFNSYRK